MNFIKSTKVWTWLSLLAVALIASVSTHVYDYQKFGKAATVYEDVYYSNLLAGYSAHVEISHNLASGAPLLAKCNADLRASGEYNELKHCLSNSQCRAYIEKDAVKIAPELLKGEQPQFRYYKPGEVCDGVGSGRQQ